MTWKYLLFAQYPACFLLAIFFIVCYLRVRKSSAVKSILWVLLFGVALAVSVLFSFLGVQEGYWKLNSIFTLGIASWIGVALVFVALIAHVVHLVEKKHNRKVMEKELEKAAKEKDAAVAQAEEQGREAARQALEEGRRAAQQEAAAERFSQAAVAADAEAAASELASAAHTPIELKLDMPESAPAETQGEAPAEPAPDNSADMPVDPI